MPAHIMYLCPKLFFGYNLKEVKKIILMLIYYCILTIKYCKRLLKFLIFVSVEKGEAKKFYVVLYGIFDSTSILKYIKVLAVESSHRIMQRVHETFYTFISDNSNNFCFGKIIILS